MAKGTVAAVASAGAEVVAGATASEVGANLAAAEAAVAGLLVEMIAGVAVIAIGTVVETAETDAVGFEAENNGRPPAGAAAKGAAGLPVVVAAGILKGAAGLPVVAAAGIPKAPAVVEAAGTPKVPAVVEAGVAPEPNLDPVPGKRVEAGGVPNVIPPAAGTEAAEFAVVAPNPERGKRKRKFSKCRTAFLFQLKRFSKMRKNDFLKFCKFCA